MKTYALLVTLLFPMFAPAANIMRLSTPAKTTKPVVENPRPVITAPAPVSRPAVVEKDLEQPPTFNKPAAKPAPKVETVVQPAPKVDVVVPKVAAPAPRVETPAPKVEVPAPRVETPAPKVVTPAPKIETQVPQVKPAQPVQTAPAAQSSTHMKSSMRVMNLGQTIAPSTTTAPSTTATPSTTTTQPQTATKPAAKKMPGGNDTTQMMVTDSKGAILYSGPGEKSKKLGTLKPGTLMEPTGNIRDGWREVEVQGRKGWVPDDSIAEAIYDCVNGNCGSVRPRPKGGFTAFVEDFTEAIRNGANGPLSYADHLQKYLHVGRKKKWKNLCWRSVWEILKAAKMVSGDLSEDSAKNALRDLSKFGFKHDPNACKRPGAVIVYGGSNVPVAARDRTLGDIHGHIEIIGADRRYHHFTTNSRGSIQTRFGVDRRPIRHCLVKE